MPSSSSSNSSAWSEPSPNSSTTSALIATPPSFETLLSPFSYESGMSSVSHFEIKSSSKLFDLENFVDDFPPTQIIDYREIQRNQGIYSSSSSKELVIYKPERQHLENLQERLEKVVKNVVYKEVKMLLLQAKGKKMKEQQLEHDSGTSVREEATDSTNEDGKQMILTVENAQVDHEGPKLLDTDLTMTQRQTRTTTTKLVAYISDVSFEIPEDFKVDNDTVNKFVPKDFILREITAQSCKKYSFIDRLHGWDMECRMRLSGGQQFDKYFTHLQSKFVMRSICEIVRFILYELNPKQLKEANRKRKVVEPGE